MNFSLVLWCYLLVYAFYPLVVAMESTSFHVRLLEALNITKAAMARIATEWQIEKYPNFLRSCFMDKNSWEISKWKYISKIIEAEVSQTKIPFVMSFTGSSVTAGHESPFIKSTPYVTGEYMKEPLAALNIDAISRSVAIGNNPCMPYDLCVKYFAGDDADIVYWEQLFSCGNSLLMYEQFIRQASNLPTKPIIVFSESSTGHWKKTECKPLHKITSYERDIFNADFHKLIHEMNQDEQERVWPILPQLVEEYPKIPIQTFTHYLHAEYACHGPYIKNWTEGVLQDYHPSVIGHRLRAAHLAYFWLWILSQAIEDVLRMYTTPKGLTNATGGGADSSSSHHNHNNRNNMLDRHVNQLYAQVNEKLHFLERQNPITSYPIRHWPQDDRFPEGQAEPIVDNIQCYTEYLPRVMHNESSLRNAILFGLNDPVIEKLKEEKGMVTTSWKFIILEEIEGPIYIEMNRKQGLLDYKYLIYSTPNSGHLSIRLPIRNRDGGPIYVCEPPTIRGILPHGFAHLMNSSALMFLSYDVPDYTTFSFDPNRSELQSYIPFHPPESINVCIQLIHKHPTDGKRPGHYPSGNHVLSIIPNYKNPILIAWIVFP